MLDVGAPESSLIFAWRSSERVAAAVAARYQTIARPVQHAYLDYLESLDASEPVAISPRPTRLRDVYKYRPECVSGIAGQVQQCAELAFCVRARILTGAARRDELPRLRYRCSR